VAQPIIQYKHLQTISLPLNANVENVVGGSAGDMLIGDGGANLLFGAGNNDMLKGGAGNDRLDGGAGIDTADFSDRLQSIVVKVKGAELATVKVGGSPEDSVRNIENIIAGLKADTLTGDALGNHLTANGGNDKLDGGGGKDLLIGGAGKDLLTGGGGADTFIFLKVSDSAGNQLDTVTDFNLKQQDVIDLSAIDAKESTGADDAFHFLATQNAAFHKAGDLHWFFKDKTTVIEGDTDGNHKADFSIVLQGHVVLTEASR
jgi:serralysin